MNKKTFSRAHKIREHLKVARQHVEELQKQEAEQERRTRGAAARRRAACERVERLEEALVEVERLQAEKKWERDKPCQASTTDPDAQFMRTSDHALAPSYNVQLATDAVHKLIVDVEVSKQPSDSLHLLPALERVHQRLGTYPQQVVADGDYTTREAVVGTCERGVDYYGSWGNPGGEQVGHGIHPDYHPNAFQYDEPVRRDDLSGRPPAQTFEHAATGRWTADQNLWSQFRRPPVLPETAALLAPERDAETRAHGKQENRAGCAEALSRQDGDGECESHLQTARAGRGISERVAQR